VKSAHNMKYKPEYSLMRDLMILLSTI